MKADSFPQWMDVLMAGLEPGEQVLAQGRAYEPHGGLDLSHMVSGPGCALVVTNHRVLWVSRNDERWVRALPFALVKSSTEITQGHRYALALHHEGIDCLRWAPAHRFLVWSWGNTEIVRMVTWSVLGFSRRETRAAGTIRSQLSAMGVAARDPLPST